MRHANHNFGHDGIQCGAQQGQHFQAMLKVRSKFPIFPHTEFIEGIPEFTAHEWIKYLNLGFEFVSGSYCYGAGNALDRPSITTHCGANVSAGVELKELWDWKNAHFTCCIW